MTLCVEGTQSNVTKFAGFFVFTKGTIIAIRNGMTWSTLGFIFTMAF